MIPRVLSSSPSGLDSFFLASQNVTSSIQYIKSQQIQYLAVIQKMDEEQCESFYEFKKELGRTIAVPFADMSNERDFVKEAETALISSVAYKHLKVATRTVEVGAGELNRQGNSHLMQRLPLEVQPYIEPTEVNPFLWQNDARIKKVDLLNFKDFYPLNSLDAVIGSSVLDTLSNKDLATFMIQARDALKDDGVLLHFSSLEPMRGSIICHYNHEGKVVAFPYFNRDGFFSGVQFLLKEDLLTFVEQNSTFSLEMREFFLWYANLTPKTREVLLEMLLSFDETPEGIAAKQFLSYIAGQIKEAGLQVVDNSKFFEERLRQSLIQTGFKVVKCSYRVHSTIASAEPVSINSLSFNYVSVELGRIDGFKCYVLAPGKLYQEVKMHILVAKK